MMQHDDTSGTRKDLVLYRLETAKEDLESARILYANKSYKGANNRAYYSIFHTVNAILALDGKAYRRHKDVIANFNKDYVHTGIFPKDLGRKISKAEEIRHASDYDDFYIAVIADVEQLISTAEEFLEAAEIYCINRLNEL